MDESGLSVSAEPQAKLPISLLEILSNTLVFYQVVPYLPLTSLLALGSASRSFQALVYDSPSVFRYLDLSQVNLTQPRPESVVGEAYKRRLVGCDLPADGGSDDAAPLESAFDNLHHRNILRDVQILVLDGLSVSVSLVMAIMNHDMFAVRILSIRDAKNLDENGLRTSIWDMTMCSKRPKSLRLQGMYIFGPHTQSEQYDGRWPAKTGPIPRAPSDAWADILHACKGRIAFDAVLCAGPRHSTPLTYDSCAIKDGIPWYRLKEAYLGPSIATHVVKACHKCGKAPEGVVTFGESPTPRLPLIAPPPLRSPTIRAAQSPSYKPSALEPFIMRCSQCIESRYCRSCHKWWCEDCYEGWKWSVSVAPLAINYKNGQRDLEPKIGIEASCLICGRNCAECIYKTQRMCGICIGGYCLIHNEGSTLDTCDWCTSSRHRARVMRS